MLVLELQIQFLSDTFEAYPIVKCSQFYNLRGAPGFHSEGIQVFMDPYKIIVIKILTKYWIVTYKFE